MVSENRDGPGPGSVWEQTVLDYTVSVRQCQNRVKQKPWYLCPEKADTLKSLDLHSTLSRARSL